MPKPKMSTTAFDILHEQNYRQVSIYRYTDNGRIYLKACEAISLILESAKKFKLLSHAESEIKTKGDLCRVTVMKMRWVHNCWSGLTNDELDVFFKKYIENKAKIELIARYHQHKTTGKYNRMGRFEGFYISGEKIWIKLNDPQEVIEIDDLRAREFITYLRTTYI